MSHLEEFEQVEADGDCIEEAPAKIKCPKCIANPPETVRMQSGLTIDFTNPVWLYKIQYVGTADKSWAVPKIANKHKRTENNLQ